MMWSLVVVANRTKTQNRCSSSPSRDSSLHFSPHVFFIMFLTSFKQHSFRILSTDSRVEPISLSGFHSATFIHWRCDATVLFCSSGASLQEDAFHMLTLLWERWTTGWNHSTPPFLTLSMVTFRTWILTANSPRFLIVSAMEALRLQPPRTRFSIQTAKKKCFQI